MTSLNTIIATILQGVAITVLGLLAYKTGYRWFKSFGSNEFKSKNTAQGTLVGFLFVSGFASEPIFQALYSLTIGLDFLQQLGLVGITSRLLVNTMVNHWTNTDNGSLLIYLLGSLFIFHNQLPYVDLLV